MKNEKMLHAIGQIDDELIYGAVNDVKAKQKKKHSWRKWAAMAACLCLVVAGGFGLSNYFESYVKANNIEVYADTENSDALSAADVTEELGERITSANNLHNTLAAQGYAWYGGCQYNFGMGKIEIGLTDLSDENKTAVLAHVGNEDVHFSQVDFSYQYLKELYDRLDEKRIILSLLGVEYYHISVEENRVMVRLSDSDDNAAIYAANEMDTAGGAILFKTTVYPADSGMQDVVNPVYDVVIYEPPLEYEANDLYVVTTSGLDEYDNHMAERYGEKHLGNGIRIFTFAEGAAEENFNVWYFDYEGTSISRIYFVTKSPKSDGKLVTGWTEAGDLGKAIEALSGKTSEETPMHLVQDDELLFAVIGDTAYFLPHDIFEPKVEAMPEIALGNLECKTITLLSSECLELPDRES